jgi:uncharacterized membrane protein
MSDLIVIAYSDETTAFQARDNLVQLQKEHLIELADAVVVVRQQDGKVQIKQAVNLAGVGALQGSFWGMFIGLLFFAPWLGLAVGAITGAISGKMADIGVDDAFIKEVGQTIQPGNSALFLLVRSATVDKVLERVKFPGKVISTSLSNEDEAKLVAALGGGE